jgi:hypothetical protein
MSRLMSRVTLAAGIVCVTAALSLAQTATQTETKAFEVIAVDGNQLIVKLPEGTRELTVPDDFRFTVNGKPLAVRELTPGMKGTAVVTTRATTVPVTVTEVKDGQVVVKSPSGVIVRTNEGVKSFSQSEVDKRGVKIYRSGKPVQIVDLHEGDRLSATIVTSLPPKILTEKEVQATTVAARAGGGAAPAAARAPATQQASAAPGQPAPAQTQAARTLPKTASSWPALALASLLSLALGFTLTMRRRLAR